jgi:hypothetical protein
LQLAKSRDLNAQIDCGFAPWAYEKHMAEQLYDWSLQAVSRSSSPHL